jgi:hypothetical protein
MGPIHHWHFLRIFVPPGVPVYMLPLVSTIAGAVRQSHLRFAVTEALGIFSLLVALLLLFAL